METTHQTTLLLGRFEIRERLGGGGSGDVYRAVDRVLNGCEVAVKLIRADWIADPEGLKKVKAEAITAREVHHRNVVRTYQFDETNGSPS